MSYNYGNNLNITLYGQSHAEAVGIVLEGIPAGEPIDMEEVKAFMARRAPGGKLATSAVRLAWCVDHVPLRDWMCWNAVMRLLLPVVGATLGLILLMEGLLGGMTGVAALLGNGLVVTLLGMMGMLLAVMLLVFILQGDDLLDCVIDARGIHVQTYLPEPTTLKLLLRGKSPQLLDSGESMLLLSSREIAWKDVARVQLWPEKTMILFYAPRWWMRVALPCTPFTWEDALDFIREKIGKKKAVVLPPECRQEAPAKAKPARKQTIQEDYLPPMPIPEEEVPPETTQELESDFTSLEDVLKEIKDAEQA